MSVIKKIKQKQQDNSFIEYDLGAKSGNVIMADGAAINPGATGCNLSFYIWNSTASNAKVRAARGHNFILFSLLHHYFYTIYIKKIPLIL